MLLWYYKGKFPEVRLVPLPYSSGEVFSSGTSAAALLRGVGGEGGGGSPKVALLPLRY